MAAKIDVTSESEWRALIEKIGSTHGRLDILVNNAGISGSSVGDPDGVEGWQRIIAVNQTSVYLGTKLAAEQMVKTGGGSIVNISSIMGFVGRVNTVHLGYMPPMLNATNAGERDDKIAMTPLRRIGKPIEVAMEHWS